MKRYLKLGHNLALATFLLSCLFGCGKEQKNNQANANPFASYEISPGFNINYNPLFPHIESKGFSSDDLDYLNNAITAEAKFPGSTGNLEKGLVSLGVPEDKLDETIRKYTAVLARSYKKPTLEELKSDPNNEIKYFYGKLHEMILIRGRETNPYELNGDSQVDYIIEDEKSGKRIILIDGLSGK
jgi:hypothetical protein